MKHTIYKTDLQVKDVNARITARALKMGNEDYLEISRVSTTYELFREKLKEFTPATIDVLVATHKDKALPYNNGILGDLNIHLSDQNIIDVAKSRNYTLLVRQPTTYGMTRQEQTQAVKMVKDRYTHIPSLKKILNNTIFVNQGAEIQDITSLIENCVPSEFEPYKDYEKFRGCITAAEKTPLYLLEYYKDYLKDIRVLGNILNKDHTDINLKFPRVYSDKLFEVQKHIVTNYSNFIIEKGAQELGYSGYGNSRYTLGEAALHFLERNAKDFKVTVDAIKFEEQPVVK